MVLLLLFFIGMGLTFDLYWVVNHAHLVERAETEWIARAYRSYSAADRGYYDRITSFELALEVINVSVTQLLNLLLLWAILARRSFRYPLQLALGSYVAYSVLLDYWVAHISGYPAMPSHTAGAFLMFYGASAPWMLGHLYLAIDAFRAIQRKIGLRTTPQPIVTARIPSFQEAQNLRQRVRAAAMHPDHWYAVEYSSALRRGQVLATRFYGDQVALFRGSDGQVHAIEDRCAHRQLPLSIGEVQRCNLVCAYHGWSYNGEGQVEEIPHDLFGRSMPRFRVRSFPVAERYGLIWIFPGNASLASERAVPDMPEYDRLPCVAVDFLWRAHHSIILDNLNDLTHSFLHRDFRPFNDPRLVECKCEGTRARLVYQTAMVEGRFSQMFFDRNTPDTDKIEIEYEYPYQWGVSGGRVRHRIFILPMDESTSRVFFFFFFEPIRIPFTSWNFPVYLMKLAVPLIRRFYVRPLLSQDGYAVEREQEAYERHFDQGLAELNPSVPLFQEILVRRWQAHLDSLKEARSFGAHV